MLAAKVTVKEFNTDYYIAVVTILPILMLAIEVLTNFDKYISVGDKDGVWPALLTLIVGFFYIFSPIIAAVGVIAGVLALMYRYTSAVTQWLTFSCLISVLAFLAISSSIYLVAFNSAQLAQEREKARAKDE